MDKILWIPRKYILQRNFEFWIYPNFVKFRTYRWPFLGLNYGSWEGHFEARDEFLSRSRAYGKLCRTGSDKTRNYHVQNCRSKFCGVFILCEKNPKERCRKRKQIFRRRKNKKIWRYQDSLSSVRVRCLNLDVKKSFFQREKTGIGDEERVFREPDIFLDSVTKRPPSLLPAYRGRQGGEERKGLQKTFLGD